jgi:hypothetical protein
VDPWVSGTVGRRPAPERPKRGSSGSHFTTGPRLARGEVIDQRDGVDHVHSALVKAFSGTPSALLALVVNLTHALRWRAADPPPPLTYEQSIVAGRDDRAQSAIVVRKIPDGLALHVDEDASSRCSWC